MQRLQILLFDCLIRSADSLQEGSYDKCQYYNKLWWRRKRDSNPRTSFPVNGFQDRRLKPLGHSSTFHLTFADMGRARVGSA